ncbi:MAG: site-2 protease family protein [Acidobacteria bacterium]|nr:MAG: site-2 protease family protein [Acidobacteriota bacterium]
MLGRPPSCSGAAKESGLAAAKSALAKAQTSMSDPSPPLTSTAEYYRPMPVWVPRARKQRYWLHALLLLLTVLTTLVVGAHMQDNFLRNQPVFSLNDDGLFSFFPIGWAFSQPSRLLLGIPFAGTLMLILLAHEMGHYLYCKRYGVFATLPFFIPAPTLIGTLGAFIRIRSPIRSRTALFDIGIAGPIAGFVVALVVLVASLGLSKPLLAVSDIQLGYPLIFELMHRLLASSSAANSAATLPLFRANLHPVALAAWVGMFATSLNLLPGGQLDGGHIVFSIAPRAHKFVSRLTILILLPMAVYFWAGWLVWAILLEISSFRHPQVADLPRVSGWRIWLAVFGLIMLILTLTPAPFAHSSLREVVQGIRTGR